MRPALWRWPRGGTFFEPGRPAGFIKRKTSEVLQKRSPRFVKAAVVEESWEAQPRQTSEVWARQTSEVYWKRSQRGLF